MDNVLIIFCVIGFLVLGTNALKLTRIDYDFIVQESTYTRLCSTKKILTVNGQFPGPTINVHKGDTIFIRVQNKGDHNITIHWHGVKMPRYPWSDGPEYITQCPIQPGKSFIQKVIFSNEEGTLWWHAHSDWSRATVHGAIFIYPKPQIGYPFDKPYEEVPIILGQWWKSDIFQVLQEFLESGGAPNASDAYTINGQPGDLYSCSKQGTFKLQVQKGKTYLLRIINAALNEMLFFAIAGHKLTIIGADASYTKPLTLRFLTISPGQTMDVLLHTNKKPGNYYMASRPYNTLNSTAFDNTTTTAIIQYTENSNSTSIAPPSLPYLPPFNDTTSAYKYFKNLKSIDTTQYPDHVPIKISTRLFTTLSINLQPCPLNYNVSMCQGPNVTRLATSISNISFVLPHVDILEAYYRGKNGVFGHNFPSVPPLFYNFTGNDLPLYLEPAKKGRKVRFLEYNETVEIIWQNTNIVVGLDHPMHLHGYSFYVVGLGFGNFNPSTDPKKYNLVDPPLLNTVPVPKGGWAVIRFTASNPGVWFVHCHFERHLTWGMRTVLIVKNGPACENATMLPPPKDMPPC
ncbi:laccase-15-like [Impatiens glandulifera]|uniref:laccase-15-like n=1 Tax=Impatiens glandulifera TaxID=253017 RepID=UPI001FB0D217|nr:laccase-15-like [Impatiens glandulifera]